MHANSESINEEEAPVKRPRMMGDGSWKNLEHADHLNNMDSFSISMEGGGEGLSNAGSPGVTSPMVSESLKE